MYYGKKTTQKKSGYDSVSRQGATGLKTLPSVPAVQKVEDDMQMKTDPIQKAGGLEEELPAAQAVFQREGALEDELPKQAVFQREVGLEDELPKQGKFLPIQRKPNNTGMPDNLKSGIENLSGMDMSDVKVHYNSPQPAQLNALAYAQGNDIHVGAGQEKHLAHEAWHVVQQRQGRVQATMQMKEGIPVNDDPGLEHEADVMGAKALGM